MNAVHEGPAIVREARPEELDAVAALVRAVFERHRPEDAAARPVFEAFVDDASDVRARRDATHLFVAVRGPVIVGTGTLYPPGAGARYARVLHARPWPPEWASLRLLAVDPAHRRRGVGRSLLDARVRRARELGARAVALHTSEAFPDGRRLIERCGWQRCPDFDHAPAPGVRAEAYVLPLG